MQFEFDTEQRALQESVQQYLAREYTFEKRRAHLAAPLGHGAAVWSAFADQGLLAVGLPAAHGGIGAETERMLVMEEMGRALVLEPYLSNVALCAPLVAALGTDAQQAALLPRLAAGELKLAFAHGEDAARYTPEFIETTAAIAGDSWLLTGAKTNVLDAGVADRLLVSARLSPDRVAVFLVDPRAPGVQLAPYRTQDGRSAADVKLRHVKLPAEARLGGDACALPAIARALECAVAALCAEAVGAMEAVNAATIDYTKNRRQFGQPIGRFQALQHRMADMFVYATQARSMSMLANGRCASGDAALRRRDIAAAKSYIARAARFVGQQAIQLHGGMGMADELPVSHYFKRLTVINSTFGDGAHHLATVSDAILAEGAPESDL